MPKTVDRNFFFQAVAQELGDIDTINRQQVLDVCDKYDISYPAWFMNDADRRVSRGVYSLFGSK